MVDALNHLTRNLLTNLDTSKVSGLLLVVTSVGAFIQTFDKLVDVGGINAQTTYEIILQTLSLSHTDSIADCVDVTLQVSLRSAVAT